MKKQSLLENRRLVLVAALMLAFALAVLVSRIVLREQPQTVTIINDVAAVACALTATLLFIGVWLVTSDQDVSKRIWGQMVVGLVASTVAEMIWAYYEVILGQEVPYPSIADLFWLFGYAMICVALFTQYRLFQIPPSAQQKRIIAALVIVFLLASSVLVLVPIIRSFNSESVLESLLDIAYPLFDQVLLILALIVIFSLGQGRFVLTWHILGAGLVFMAMADLMFSYSSWHEIYYPELRLNSITLLIDTLYYVAYLALGLAAYSYSLISNSLRPAPTMNIVLHALTRSSILIFVGVDGKIISLSDNFLNLVHSPTKDRYVKMPLHEAIKIDQTVIENLIAETIKYGSLSTQPVVVRDVQGHPKDAWLTSLAAYDDQKNLVCIAIVLRTDLDLQGEEERQLNEEQKMLVNYYLTQAGTYRAEENQVIKTYFLAQLSLLHSLVQQFSGTPVADKLLVHLNQVAGKHNWQFNFTEQEISIPKEYEGHTLAERMAVLLREARSFAVNMISVSVVVHEMRNLDNTLSTENLRYIDKYNLRSMVSSAD